MKWYWCDRFYLKGTIITITLDMNKPSLSFKINDKDFGVATNELDRNKYRLVINLLNPDAKIELL